MRVSFLGLLATTAAFICLPAVGQGCGADETGSAASTAAGGSGTGGGTAGGGGEGGASSALKTNADCSPAEGAVGSLTLTQVASANVPVMVQHAWGDSERIYVVDLLGIITAVESNGAMTPFLDITGVVEQDGEGGLLGLAFHPDYSDNGRFFVHYTELSAPLRSVIAEYRRDPNNPAVADPNEVGRLLTVEQPYSNHDGGSIDFSPIEELLYIGWGDGGLANDPLGSGQDKTTLLGALSRIDVATAPYTIPAGNITDGAPEIFHYGLRNPYRFGFDQCTGDLYIGDVGQDQWEEVDIAALGEGPINWGWDCREGNNDFEPQNCTGAETLAPAAHEYPHVSQSCGGSITGGSVYRGSAIPWLRGAYIYGDFCTGQVWMPRYENGVVVENTDITADLTGEGAALGPQSITGFGNDNDGNVYVVSINGQVFRVDPQ